MEMMRFDSYHPAIFFGYGVGYRRALRRRNAGRQRTGSHHDVAAKLKLL